MPLVESALREMHGGQLAQGDDMVLVAFPDERVAEIARLIGVEAKTLAPGLAQWAGLALRVPHHALPPIKQREELQRLVRAFEGAEEALEALSAATEERLWQALPLLPAYRAMLYRFTAAAERAGGKIRVQRGPVPDISSRRLLANLSMLYEELTGREATRGVDRITGEETGPFLDFARQCFDAVGRDAVGISHLVRKLRRRRRRS